MRADLEHRADEGVELEPLAGLEVLEHRGLVLADGSRRPRAGARSRPRARSRAPRRPRRPRPSLAPQLRVCGERRRAPPSVAPVRALRRVEGGIAQQLQPDLATQVLVDAALEAAGGRSPREAAAALAVAAVRLADREARCPRCGGRPRRDELGRPGTTTQPIARCGGITARDRAAGVDALDAVARRAARRAPWKYHHGIPFCAATTAVVGPEQRRRAVAGAGVRVGLQAEEDDVDRRRSSSGRRCVHGRPGSPRAADDAHAVRRMRLQVRAAGDEVASPSRRGRGRRRRRRRSRRRRRRRPSCVQAPRRCAALDLAGRPPSGCASTTWTTPRHLERRQPLAAVAPQLVRVDSRVVDDHGRRDDLAPLRVRDPVGDRLADRRVREQRLVDLARGDLLAAAVDQLLEPAVEREIAVGEGARGRRCGTSRRGTTPRSPPRCRGSRRPRPARAPTTSPAAPGGDRLPVLVEDRDLGAGRTPTVPARRSRRRQRVARHLVRRLGHAVGLDDRHAEALLERVQAAARARTSTSARTAAARALVGRAGSLARIVGTGREPGDAVLAHVRPEARPAGPPRHGHRAAARRAPPASRRRVRARGRAASRSTSTSPAPRPYPSAIACAEAARLRWRSGTAFGPARRPARVQEQRDGVRVHIGERAARPRHAVDRRSGARGQPCGSECLRPGRRRRPRHSAPPPTSISAGRTPASSASTSP